MIKKKVLFGVCVGVIAVLSVGWWFNSDAKVRRDLKALCKKDDCTCFQNVIDYRFSSEEARIYWRITQEAKVRPNASSLEFTDPVTYRNIMSALAVCQIRTPVAQPKPQQVSVQPAEKPAVKAPGKTVPAAPKSKPTKK